MKRKLGDIFEISSGGTPSKLHPEYYDGNIPWVKTGDLKWKYLYDVEDYITEKGLNNSSAKMYEANTVLIAMYGATIGATSILKFPACTNQACAAFKKNEEVLQEYLYFFLKSKRKKFIKDGVGGAQPNISVGYLKNVDWEVRNLEEQHEIVNVLNNIQYIVEQREQEMQLLDELIKARFVELFGDAVDNPMGWEKKQLQEIVTDDCTISYGIVQTGNDQEEGVPVFRPVDIVNRIPKLEELKRTTEEISNKYKRTILKGHEMLITVRANIADTCIVGKEFKGCNVGRGIVPIRTQENIMVLEFLKYLMDSKHLNDDIKSKAKGITLIQLNMEDLREVELIVPPIEQQKAFVEFAEQVNKSKFGEREAVRAWRQK